MLSTQIFNIASWAESRGKDGLSPAHVAALVRVLNGLAGETLHQERAAIPDSERMPATSFVDGKKIVSLHAERQRRAS